MRFSRSTAVLLLMVLPPAATRAGDKKTKSALEASPKGWIDLMPDKALTNWRRVPLPPDVKVNARNPWSLSEDGKTLICDGVGVKEMFLHRDEQGDGIFHVEWRFRKSDKEGYNSGVYVRSQADGKVWHQAQVAMQDKPPQVGDLFGETLRKDKVEKFQITGSGHKHVNPVGEWNTYEITCQGKKISVWLNGFVVTTWDDCAVTKGHLGMQAEYFYIEFRNLKYKALTE